MTRAGSLLLRLTAPLLVVLLGAATAQAQTVLFSDDFENGAGNWLMDPYWHLADSGSLCLTEPFPSGTHGMWYGREDTCGYEGEIDFQSLQLTTSFLVPTEGGTPFLEFWSRTEVEFDTFWDTRVVEVNWGVGWFGIYQIWDQSQPWTLHSVDLSAYAGQTIGLRFTFWAGDDFANDYLGWQVDDVVVRTTEDVYPVSCFGDGTVAACPCSNSGVAGHGCQNSAGTGGALLAAEGNTIPDTIILSASGELPSALTIFLQGSTFASSVWFGDGLRCAGGQLKRLYVKNASGGVVTAPAAGDPSISQRSLALGDLLDPGSRRYYQTYYRDPNAGFCPPPQGSTFNSSQMVKIVW